MIRIFESKKNEIYQDQKEWISLGYLKFVRMDVHLVMKKWDVLADCRPGFLPPELPKIETITKILEELEREGELFRDNLRSKNHNPEYVSVRIHKAWKGLDR